MVKGPAFVASWHGIERPHDNVWSHAKITRSDDVASLSNCFVKHHPDAEAWKPGASESPHTAFWVRFSPHEIHYVGGFGDEHFIGAVDMQQYRSYDVRIDADATASSLSPPSRSLELPVVHFQS